MFRFTQEPSSGSRSQCLAKITSMVPLCFLIRALPLAMHVTTSTARNSDLITLASSQQNLYDVHLLLCVYSTRLLIMDRKHIRKV
jgi:hypothetical protein